MTKKQAKHIFDKYNPQNAVIRCPSGRGPVRKQLNTYAKAAVNLYGIIPTKDFVEIFNSQNTEQTTVDEVFLLLLPGILKESKHSKVEYYCFYKDNIIHYWAAGDFNFGDYWLREQGDKPRYIPEKNEFLEYESEFYEDEVQELHWEKVFKFLLKEWPNNLAIYKFFNELKDISQLSGELGIHELLRTYNLSLSSKEQVQPFLDLVSAAHNNTRMWINKGNTPEELFKDRKNLYKEKVKK